MMKRRILFVDDEPNVLDGLQSLLRKQRKRWDMFFSNRSEEVLAEFQRKPFDVIVSDVRMPIKNGLSLLEDLKEHYPRTVRIILSGHTEMSIAIKAVPIAHRYLSKPCPPKKLVEVIENSCQLIEMLDNSTIQGIVGKIGSLPGIPETYMKLSKALDDPESSAATLSRIVESDIAVCGKLLQVVNSSFFGLSRTVTQIPQAISILGGAMLKNLVLSVELAKAFEKSNWPDGFDLDFLQRHATIAAKITHHILPKSEENRGLAYLTGLLHDTGLLILAAHMPDFYDSCSETMRQQGLIRHEAEYALMGVSHAEIGAYLLGLWGLPLDLVEAVANHHRPKRFAHEQFGLVDAIHLGDYLAHKANAPQDHHFYNQPKLDETYLVQLGVRDQLDEWERYAEGLDRSPGDS